MPRKETLVMYYDVILFTELQNSFIPSKGAGAYKIASFIRNKGHTVKTIGNVCEIMGRGYQDKLFDYLDDHIGPNTMFVGFSVTFITDMEVLTPIIEQIYFKYPHVKIIFGGHGPSAVKFVKNNEMIDYYFKGVAEDILESYLNGNEPIERVTWDFNRAGNFDFHNSSVMLHEDDVVFPNEVIPLEISRGCMFKCKFCALDQLGRKPEDKYYRSEDSLYEEFKFNYENFGTTQYNFMCDTFNESEDKMLNVLRAKERAKVDLNFWSYTRIDLLHAYPERIKIMKDIGVRAVFFGIESLHDPSAKEIGKGLGRERVFEMFHKLKEEWGKEVVLHGSFIVGLPHETPDTASEWLEMIANRDFPIDSAGAGPLRLQQQRGENAIAAAQGNISEFDRNAEKYGYERTKKDVMNGKMGGKVEWTNEHFTYDTAKKLAHKWMKPIAAGNLKGYDICANGRYMDLITAGYSWDDVIDNNVNEKEALVKGSKVHEEYINRIFEK